MFGNDRDPFNFAELCNQMNIIRQKNEMILDYLYRCGEDCWLFNLCGLQQVLFFNGGFKNRKLKENLERHGFINDNTVLIFPLEDRELSTLSDIIFSTEGIGQR